MSNTPAKLRTARCATGDDPLGQDFRLRLLVRRHRHPNPTGEPLRDLREVRDQDHLLEDLAHPEEFLDEEFPRDLRVEGAEVAFVDEQRLHATERAADLRNRGEFPCDRETQGRVDLRLLAPAELRDIVPLPVYSLDENPDSVTPALFVRLQADATKPTVRELGQILRGFDLQFRQELIDRIHDDTALVEHPIHEDIVDFELAAERLSLSFRLFQFHRVRFETCDLFLQRGGLSLEEVPRLPLRIEFSLQRLDPRLCRAECLLRRSESREFRFEGRALGLEGLALHREVRESRAHVADLPQQDRELIEPLPLPGFFKDGLADEFPPLLVLVLREVELPPRRASGCLALQVSRLRFLQAVQFLPQAVEVFDLFLEGGSFRFEFRGDLALISDFRLAGLERFQPGRPVL